MSIEGHSLHEYKIDSSYEQGEGCKMIPVQALASEEDVGDNGEDDEADHLLDNLELYQGEGTSVALESQSVGRNLAAVFEEGDCP